MKFPKAVPSALIHAYDCYLSYLTNLNMSIHFRQILKIQVLNFASPKMHTYDTKP